MTLATLLCTALGPDDPNTAPEVLRGNIPVHAAKREPPVVTDDATIIEHIRAGHRETFDALFLKHYTALCDFAARYVGRTSAADVVAETFLRLWMTCADWTPRTSVRAYLYGAVRRTAIDAYRAAHAEDRRHATLLGADETWGMATGPISPGAIAESNTVRALVRRAIATLPETQRTVLTLRWHAGLSWDEVAAALGTTSAAVRMQHSRALGRLRAMLPEHLADG